MSKFELVNGSCLEQEVDVVVNAANRQLLAGGGICGAIFAKAGYEELTDACNVIGAIQDGEVAATPAFNIKNAKLIFHAVGPNFGITPNATDKLKMAYLNSLILLKEHELHSISFPLISSGIFGGNLENPIKTSVENCIEAYNTFTEQYPDYDVDVKLCAFTKVEQIEAEKELKLKRA